MNKHGSIIEDWVRILIGITIIFLHSYIMLNATIVAILGTRLHSVDMGKKKPRSQTIHENKHIDH